MMKPILAPCHFITIRTPEDRKGSKRNMVLTHLQKGLGSISKQKGRSNVRANAAHVEDLDNNEYTDFNEMDAFGLRTLCKASPTSFWGKQQLLVSTCFTPNPPPCAGC